MALSDFLETGTMIKFGVIFGLLAFYIIFVVDNTLKWKILLTLGAFIGTAIALGGGTIGRDHSLMRR